MLFVVRIGHIPEMVTKGHKNIRLYTYVQSNWAVLKKEKEHVFQWMSKFTNNDFYLFLYDLNILLNGCLLSINIYFYTCTYITAVCKHNSDCKLTLQKSLCIANLDFCIQT